MVIEFLHPEKYETKYLFRVLIHCGRRSPRIPFNVLNVTLSFTSHMWVRLVSQNNVRILFQVYYNDEKWVLMGLLPRTVQL